MEATVCAEWRLMTALIFTRTPLFFGVLNDGGTIVYRSRIIYPPQLARPKVADDAKMQNIAAVVPLGSALSLSSLASMKAKNHF